MLVRIDGSIGCDLVEASGCEFVFAGAKSSMIVGMRSYNVGLQRNDANSCLWVHAQLGLSCKGFCAILFGFTCVAVSFQSYGEWLLVNQRDLVIG